MDDRRNAEEMETMLVAVSARVRIFGVHPTHARDPKAGSFVGRLRLMGEISAPQHDAAERYHSDHTAHAIALGLPAGPMAVDLNRVHGLSLGEMSPEDRERIIARFRAAEKAVQDAQDEVRGRFTLFAAVDYLVLRGEGHHHLIGDLRIALNALVRHYDRVDKHRRA